MFALTYTNMTNHVYNEKSWTNDIYVLENHAFAVYAKTDMNNST